MDTDRNLLFGVLALQADLIDRERFVQACTLWAARKDTPIADLLVEQGWLTAEGRAAIDLLIAFKLRKHAGDVQASLAEAASGRLRALLASFPDDDVHRSVAGLPAGEHELAADVALQDMPPGTMAGRNVLYEEIGRGGMGCVLRGRDPELGRDLAVKVLRDEYRDDLRVRRRFVEEAQLGGQLQHPAVVPVYELGRFPDSRPYFTMKLVKGRTLADLLRDRPNPGHELPRFIGIFEQVCQAVAYAHSKGVIHRDLKPSNVMVGAFGEVQVMDWGLAKVLGVSAADPEATTARTKIRTVRTGSTAEEDGRTGVVGTPAFMAPEQARGELERVDARADVFGLGAILCVILTGEPPYAGAGGEEALRQATTGNLAPAFGRLEACQTDRELLALCRECLAPHPDGRPGDAAAVARAVAALRAAADERARQAELERVKAEGAAREAQARADEQRKRRQVLLRASGVIALVLVAGLAVSLWQMFRAIDAEGQANQNAQQARNESQAKDLALAAEKHAREDEAKARQQAFGALRSIATNVVERKLTQGVVLTEEDRAFLRGIIAQFDAFAAIKGDDADSRALRAEARLRVGTMRRTLAELQEAEKDFDQALDIWEQLVAEFPTRPDFREGLAGSYNNRANLLGDTGRLQEAEKDYDQALGIWKQLAAESPTRPDFRLNLALSYINRIRLMRDTGRLPEAEQGYDQALGIWKQLAADFPTRPEFREHLARTYHNRGNLLIETGRPREAEKDCDQALGIWKQLVAEFPTQPDFRQKLAASYQTRGNALGETGRLPEAEQDYGQALRIHKQLAAEFPARPEFREHLARSHGSRGNLLRAMGRLPEAEQDYDQALRIFKQLVADSPTQSDLRDELALTCVNLASLHHQQGHLAAAKRLLLEGRPHHLAALKANPRNPGYRQSYHNHLGLLTLVHAGLLEKEDAIRTAETRRDLGWDAPVDAYDAACCLSLCIPIVARHDKLDDKQRKEAAQFYGDQAMKRLREAVGKGWRNVTHMRKDPDLIPLRPREDFQKLLAELEGKGK
jgi:tetratricopeptide (TPR) repeat protein